MRPLVLDQGDICAPPGAPTAQPEPQGWVGCTRVAMMPLRIVYSTIGAVAVVGAAATVLVPG
jgi:hypothetical protein